MTKDEIKRETQLLPHIPTNLKSKSQFQTEWPAEGAHAPTLQPWTRQALPRPFKNIKPDQI